uniref:Uncharacterized protein n=1 Tax=Aegilops tauschii TaxID=37682 RepID=N1R166_AEGTA
MAERAAAAVSLPEDAVREILVRVESEAALFRCAVTCKRWSRLVADPSFLRRRWPDDQWVGRFLAGFFAPKRLDRTDHMFRTGEPMFATFFVPMPRNLEFDKSGYAILTRADCSSSATQQSSQPGCSTFFKVLITGRRYLGLHSLYTFSSSEARWSKPIQLTLDTTEVIHDCLHPDGAVSCAKVHWSVGDWSCRCSLDMDMETYHISRARIMTRTIYGETHDDPQLGVTTNGTPLVLTLSRPGLQLKICTQQDDKKSEHGAIAKARRLTTRIVELKPPRQIERRPNEIYLRLLGEKSGTMLLKDSQRQIYIADTETGVMEEFELPHGFDGLNRSKIVLLEMDWLALFVFRLGKW